jgi:hypothetical protein
MVVSVVGQVEAKEENSECHRFRGSEKCVRVAGHSRRRFLRQRGQLCARFAEIHCGMKKDGPAFLSRQAARGIG